MSELSRNRVKNMLRKITNIKSELSRNRVKNMLIVIKQKIVHVFEKYSFQLYISYVI